LNKEGKIIGSKLIKIERFKLPENNIPEEFHLRTKQLAKSLMKLPPESRKDFEKRIKKSG